MRPVINREVAKKVLETVDKGLSKGLGKPVPGSMCVEAAVCYALGLPHSDDPNCVGYAVRAFKITLNDMNWSSPEARAKGLRRVAIAQLGSDSIDQVEFVKELALQTTKQILPIALRAAANLIPEHQESLEAAATVCESVSSSDAAARAAHAAARAARAAARAARAADVADAAAYAADDVADAAARAADAAADAAARAAAYAAARAAAYAAADVADVADAAAYAAAYAAARAAARAARAADVADAAAYAADAAAYAADAAARAAARAADSVLAKSAEIAVQILIKLKSPGAEWLDLCD